jgi:hypothetical protein
VDDVELTVEVGETAVDVIEFKRAVWRWVVDCARREIDRDYAGMRELERHRYRPATDQLTPSSENIECAHQVPVPKPSGGSGRA